MDSVQSKGAVQRHAATIISRWDARFRAQFGGSLPRDYLAVDTETSGFDRQRDLIVQWGHALVHDGRVIDRGSVLIDWFKHPLVDQEYLSDQLRITARKMQLDGRVYRVSEELLRRDGADPAQAVPWMYAMLEEARRQRCMLVMHNGWNFDVQMLDACFRRELDKPFPFDPNLLFDTGAVVKASQMDSPAALPQPHENMRAYFQRIVNTRLPGIKWNLDTYCVAAFDLAEKIASENAHEAGSDAYMLHLLMEKFRALEDRRAPSPPMAPPSPAATTSHYRRQLNH